MLRNLDTNARHEQLARPGHWNDPDYLAPELGMAAEEAQAQVGLWAIVAAPLIIGADVRGLARDTIAMLSNKDVIAIDQDPLGAQGGRVKAVGDVDAWVKPLANGDRAVALLNRGSAPRRVVADASELGLPSGAGLKLRDVWTEAYVDSTGGLSADVPPRSAALYRAATGGFSAGRAG